MFYNDLINVLPRNLKSAFAVAYETAKTTPGTSGRAKNNYKLAAVLLSNSRPIAVGTNSYKTHPGLSRYTIYPFRHAESSVILSCGREMCRGKNIFVVRVKKDNSIGMAKPCQVCQRIIKDFGIRRCYYTSEKGWLVL